MKMHPALLQQLTAAAAEVVAGLEAAGLQPTHSALAVAFEQIVQALPAAAPPGARAPAAAAAAAAPIGPGQAQQRFYSGVLLSHMSSATSPRPAGSQLLEFEQELATALSLSAAEGDRAAQLGLDGEQTDINLAMAISASLSPAPAPSRVNPECGRPGGGGRGRCDQAGWARVRDRGGAAGAGGGGRLGGAGDRDLVWLTVAVAVSNNRVCKNKCLAAPACGISNMRGPKRSPPSFGMRAQQRLERIFESLVHTKAML